MKLFATTIHRDLWWQFLKKSRIQVYAKGEIILLQDQEPSRANIIKSGVVRVYNITPEGDERTISFDTEDEIFPFAWVFGEIKKTQYFYQAWTDVEVYALRREDFLRYLKYHPKMVYELYANVAARFTAQQGRIYALEQPKASDKIAHMLLYLCNRFGKKAGERVTQIELPLTQQELANFIGLTRETTSVELKKLERLNVLHLKNKHYQVDMVKLKKLTDS